jgi:hypothetical protein
MRSATVALGCREMIEVKALPVAWRSELNEVPSIRSTEDQMSTIIQHSNRHPHPQIPGISHCAVDDDARFRQRNRRRRDNGICWRSGRFTPEAAGLSPGDPQINNRLSNDNNSKFLIARLLMVKVVNGRKHINLRQIHIRRQDFSFSGKQC